MPGCELDHLVVVAPTLERGVEFVAHALGVEPGPGGVHPRMGTHNRLLRLGDGAFLEVIAIDPGAPAPGRPRWFGLDQLGADDAPRLATWVARTDDLAALPAAALAPLGAAATMTRAAREWLITIPADGRPPHGGALPALIQWRTPARSAAFDLPDRGCALAGLTIATPWVDVLRASLSALGFAPLPALVDGPRVALAATISTPRGPRTLGGAS